MTPFLRALFALVQFPQSSTTQGFDGLAVGCVISSIPPRSLSCAVLSTSSSLDSLPWTQAVHIAPTMTAASLYSPFAMRSFDICDAPHRRLRLSLTAILHRTRGVADLACDVRERTGNSADSISLKAF
ncbi:uncharacterized protein SCHCODRAFT_02623953 [Schizophyllum commune H4-8]|uniref:uncharacterized protein n=1 Tax=Schizophyllum commune (strain H4-8 / FGSC 9210) TaxID=578458 RepID=UPI00215EAB08|nr:uncharacterized protein SCHCODRAFT_02623953 [Schizophyllum commune H4-8]KAI5894183.1 hypothetical protein SCHCODRAFT_02623953 [Schizophyllum commune H4-8]